MFFWKGKSQTEDRVHGVGFAIRTTLLKNISDLPAGISERLMKMRIPLSHSRYVTVISAYAPTLTSSDEVKELFYKHLDQIIRSTPQSDKLVLLGDFNARVGKDTNNWGGVLGRHGVGKVNDNGLLLLSKCAEHSLCITNTTFRMADKYKTTWMHPRSNHWHMIDFIIVRQRDIRDVRVTHAMRGAECCTDHRLVRAVTTLHIAPPQRNRSKMVRTSFNIPRLKDPNFQSKFHEKLEEKFQHSLPTNSSYEKWSSFKDAVIQTSKEVLGPKTRTHEDGLTRTMIGLKKLSMQKTKPTLRGKMT